ENTIEAFQLAIEQGGAGVELDVRRTSDGMLVVHHDAVIEGVGPIIETRAADLPDHVPGLEDALDACSGSIVNVEIKNSPSDPDWDPDDDVAGMVAALVTNRAGIVVSSFNPATVAAVGAVSPQVARGLLLPPGVVITDVLVDTGAAGIWALHPHWSSLERDTVAAIHDAGLVVVVWTVDDPKMLQLLASWEVDVVISNDVAAAVAALT
ncbi:MAG: glycerophosphodiester phosphodiesterase, partial [Acidimicrobiia bacterium]|nr:glycerophosphodiester phosphodiesterase [Acidimicrobiia bacterium]